MYLTQANLLNITSFLKLINFAQLGVSDNGHQITQAGGREKTRLLIHHIMERPNIYSVSKLRKQKFA